MIDPGTLMRLTPSAADGGLRTASDARSGAGRGAGGRTTDDGGFTSALSNALTRAGQRGERGGDLLVADGGDGGTDVGTDAADADVLLDGLLADAATGETPVVGLGATIAALLQSRMDLAALADAVDADLELIDAVAADLVDAVLAEGVDGDGAVVDGALLDGDLLDGDLADAELLDGELLDGELADGAPVEGVPVDAELLDGELADDVPVDGELADGTPLDDAPADADPDAPAPVDGEPVDGALPDVDAPAGEVPADADDQPAEDDATDDVDGEQVLTAPTDAAAAERPGRGNGADRAGQRVDGPAAEGNRHGRSAEVRQDAFAPGQQRAERPDATRAATQADATRIPVQASAADTAAEVAQSVVRDAAARQVTLPPALQRLVDAAAQLEHLPPPRQLTLDLGEVRVRISLDDGGLRLTQLSGDQDVGDDLLREAMQLLQEQGFDLAGDGDGTDAGDDDTGPGRSPSATDADRGRRARRGGLRL